MDFIGWIEDFLNAVGVELPWFGAAFLVVWGSWAAYSKLALKKPATLAAIRVQLRRRKPAVVYRDIMAPRLEALARWLTPETVEDHPPPEKWWRDWTWYVIPRAPDHERAMRTGQYPFSWRIFDTALLVAVVYPLFLLLIFWAWTGRDGRLGGATLLPAEPRDWLRHALIGALVLLICSGSIEKSLASSRIRVLQVSGWTQALAFALAVAVAGALALVVAVAFALAGIVALAVRRGAGAPAYLVWIAVLLGTQLILVAGTDFAGSSFGLRGTFLFIGILPLLNGVFDYISYGVTLTLIRAGVRRGTGLALLYGIVDIALAFLLFTGLGAAMIATVAAMNMLSGGPVYDLPGVFADLRDPAARRDYWWLYAMMFSTALPTLIHAGLASLSLQGFYTRSFRQRMLGWLDRAGTDLDAEIRFHFFFSLMRTISMLAPVVVVGLVAAILWDHADEIGGAYLQIFERIAVWLGQVDQAGGAALPQGGS